MLACQATETVHAEILRSLRGTPLLAKAVDHAPRYGTVRGTSARAGYPACDTLLNQPCRPDAFP
jgi:hypothetical protein